MNYTVRGVDHIGITVDDMEAAGRFLVEGLGAELIYETLSPTQPAYEGPQFERLLNLPPGTRLDQIRMYKVGNGPGFELFHYIAEGRRPAARACDRGLQHIALYADDLDAAVARMVAAGGTQLDKPWTLQGLEGGKGNRFGFVVAPFGAIIEVLTLPTPQPYEQITSLRRWTPPR